MDATEYNHKRLQDARTLRALVEAEQDDDADGVDLLLLALLDTSIRDQEFNLGLIECPYSHDLQRRTFLQQILHTTDKILDSWPTMQMVSPYHLLVSDFVNSYSSLHTQHFYSCKRLRQHTLISLRCSQHNVMHIPQPANPNPNPNQLEQTYHDRPRNKRNKRTTIHISTAE